MPEFRQRWSAPRPTGEGPPEPPGKAAPRPETLAEGTLLHWLWGSLLGFGAFLVLVPGRGGSVWYLALGVLLVLVSVPMLVRAVLARRRFLRSQG